MIDQIVGEYLRIFPEDKLNLKVLLRQLQNGQRMNDRLNYTGHIVGSTLVFSPDLKRILLIYHPTFERWQQPGGHWDPVESGPWLAAKREAIEETGVKLSRALNFTEKKVPILIESHTVPTKPPKNEPSHYHHAFWYAYVALSTDLSLTDKVIKYAKWAGIAEIKDSKILKAINRIDKQLKAAPTNRTIKK